MTVRLPAVLCLALTSLFAQSSASSDRAQPVSLAELSSSLERLTIRVRPAVVQVFTRGLAPLGDDAEGTTTSLFTTQRATGSGVLLSADGFILTNAHVVRGGRRIQVRLARNQAADKEHGSLLLAPGRTVEARVVGADAESDLALLKIQGAGLPFLRLGDSDKLRQGQLVMAFGNPLGLESSVTMGIVSSPARQVRPEDPMVYIQTDAPINPGNSGGPLIDSGGEVVGINTFILSQSGGSEGIGFAVPSNIVRNVYDQLRKTGRVRRGEIRAYAQTITPALASGLKLPREEGVVLADVEPRGPAAEAGLQAGDVIVALNGKPMENARQFDVNLYQAFLNEFVTVEFLRGEGPPRAVKVRVVEREDDPLRFADKADPEKNVVRRLGILGVTLSSDLLRMVSDLRYPWGVIVALSSSDATANGLAGGDVIFAVNGHPVKSLDELRSAVAAVKPHAPLVLQVQRDDRVRYVSVDIE